MASTLTLRQYLIIRALTVTTKQHGHSWVDWSLASEAVATTALEHPEWNMDEKNTWEGWKKRHG
jgi:1-deoxy-D-xylulose 5-phosphate reductoisomerase